MKPGSALDRAEWHAVNLWRRYYLHGIRTLSIADARAIGDDTLTALHEQGILARKVFFSDPNHHTKSVHLWTGDRKCRPTDAELLRLASARGYEANYPSQLIDREMVVDPGVPERVRQTLKTLAKEIPEEQKRVKLRAEAKGDLLLQKVLWSRRDRPVVRTRVVVVGKRDDGSLEEVTVVVVSPKALAIAQVLQAWYLDQGQDQELVSVVGEDLTAEQSAAARRREEAAQELFNQTAIVRERLLAADIYTLYPLDAEAVAMCRGHLAVQVPHTGDGEALGVLSRKIVKAILSMSGRLLDREKDFIFMQSPRGPRYLLLKDVRDGLLWPKAAEGSSEEE